MKIGPESNFPQKPLNQAEQKKDDKSAGLFKPAGEKEAGKSKSIGDLLDPKEAAIDFAGLEGKDNKDDKPKPISQFGLNVFLFNLWLSTLNKAQAGYLRLCNKFGIPVEKSRLDWHGNIPDDWGTH